MTGGYRWRVVVHCDVLRVRILNDDDDDDGNDDNEPRKTQSLKLKTFSKVNVNITN